MSFKKLMAMIFSCLMAVSIQAKEKVFLTSLEWPPYAGANLPEQGASVAVAKAAFDAMGYELVVEFYPWSRAVNLAKNNPKYAGYFPEYFSEGGTKDWIFSESMGNSPLGFAQPANKPVSWSSMKDLEQYTIGVVRGYVNTAEFDSKVANGEIKAIPVTADMNNMQKVATGRIDMAVIDKNVMNYLFNNEPELKSLQGKASFNDKLLEDKTLHVAFKKSAKGEELSKVFNDGLKKIDVKAIMAKYLN